MPRHIIAGRLLQNRLLSVLSGAVVAAAGVSAVPVWAPAAHAHIPTEAVLNNNRGGEGGFSRSELTALQQLAAPPTAIVTPAGRPPPRNVEAEWPFESRPAAAPGDSSGAGTDGGGSGGGSGGGGGGRASLPPGTVVGTPNYLARDGGAGRLPGGAAAAAAAGGGARAGASEAAVALQLLTSAREAVDAGEHQQAYALYSALATQHGGLALSHYGRLGAALQAYQLGRVSDSLLALEDEEVALRGAAEVHAALAALLYVERPSLALRAEEEWAIACSFDKRYSDPAWVAAAKHWPPRAVAALQRFLALS
ncbi:hypothetical protein CHLRE_01g055151v5 [Chlamydomonas reinhardtii]|uniref:Uncharacterized protein n=1 Tax=Chlamydomonas reinhardtii TaxID=3055 RepID=A0A2K3E8B6_CHLRE|nr:uncharacterized protein CHLRE_01g055151v5 [Chlamydomonas reinhardtii]PNW89022.1 hypothetical protein CHLRE_01g055151v5 [Chlamydomonas reinhardtii]